LEAWVEHVAADGTGLLPTLYEGCIWARKEDGRETDAEGQATQEADTPPKEAPPMVGGQLLLVETRTQPTLFDTGKE
jgi:hypothetical protein